MDMMEGGLAAKTPAAAVPLPQVEVAPLVVPSSASSDVIVQDSSVNVRDQDIPLLPRGLVPALLRTTWDSFEKLEEPPYARVATTETQRLAAGPTSTPQSQCRMAWTRRSLSCLAVSMLTRRSRRR